MSKNTSSSNGPSVVRYAMYAVLFVVVLVLSLFAGPLMFHFSFQKELEAVAERIRGDCVIEIRPETLAVARPEGGENSLESGDWHRIVDGDVSFFLPPGSIKSIAKNGTTLVVKYESGDLRVDRMPAGFLKQTYLKILENLNADPENLPREIFEASEELVLERVAVATLEDYHFGLDETERTIYSADLLTKMLLWEMEGVAPFVLLKADDRRGVFFLKSASSAKVTVVCPQGFFVYSADGVRLAPPSERDPWLEITTISEAQRRDWAQKVLDGGSADDDPLRAWAAVQAE
jgi:hypothetical protein